MATSGILHQLAVMETFYSIQGEGFHTGKAAFFIRLGGCDVGCHWCDVKESWPVEEHPFQEVSELVTMASSFPSKRVIITGGEPFMQDLTEITGTLRKNNFKVHVETAGTHPFTGDWDWICLSPKKFVPAREEYFIRADEIKIIVYNENDISWAQSFTSKIRPDCKRFLQPEWGKSAEMMPKIVEFVKKDPTWEISLQTHKYLQVP